VISLPLPPVVNYSIVDKVDMGKENAKDLKARIG
jgi:hypothetical protein